MQLTRKLLITVVVYITFLLERSDISFTNWKKNMLLFLPHLENF